MRHLLPILLVACAALDAQTSSQTVVFVCEHGAAKSVVAAALFNKLATERGLPFRAVSRGTAPDAMVPAPITTGLANEGLTVAKGFTPTLIGVQDVSKASRVVTFDVSLPVTADESKLTKWDRLPAFSDGYSPASAAVAAKVEALIKELQATNKKP